MVLQVWPTRTEKGQMDMLNSTPYPFVKGSFSDLLRICRRRAKRVLLQNLASCLFVCELCFFVVTLLGPLLSFVCEQMSTKTNPQAQPAERRLLEGAKLLKLTTSIALPAVFFRRPRLPTYSKNGCNNGASRRPIVSKKACVCYAFLGNERNVFREVFSRFRGLL